MQHTITHKSHAQGLVEHQLCQTKYKQLFACQLVLGSELGSSSVCQRYGWPQIQALQLAATAPKVHQTFEGLNAVVGQVPVFASFRLPHPTMSVPFILLGWTSNYSISLSYHINYIKLWGWNRLVVGATFMSFIEVMWSKSLWIQECFPFLVPLGVLFDLVFTRPYPQPPEAKCQWHQWHEVWCAATRSASHCSDHDIPRYAMEISIYGDMLYVYTVQYILFSFLYSVWNCEQSFYDI